MSSSSKSFWFLWLAQMMSLLGTDITKFGLRVWAFRNSHSIQSYAFVTFASEAPSVLMSPIAGVIVDRCSRKKVLMLSDTIAALSSLALFMLFTADQLRIEHVLITNAIQSICNAFQWPAFMATMTLLIHSDKLTKYGAINEAVPALSMLLAPGLSGALLASFGLPFLFQIEFATFMLAQIATWIATIPHLQNTTDSLHTSLRALLHQSTTAFRFICERSGLTALLSFMFITNFSAGVVQVLTGPLILSFAGAQSLGAVLTASGFGALLGSILLGIFQPPFDAVHTLLIAIFIQGCLQAAVGLSPTTTYIVILAFLYMTLIPIVRVSRNSIWQRKTPIHLQGRVFALQSAIKQCALPLAALVAGPLAEKIFEPLLATSSSSLATTFVGRYLGIGNGRGIALLFCVLGVLVASAALAGILFKPLRYIEHRLPNYSIVEPKRKKRE